MLALMPLSYLTNLGPLFFWQQSASDPPIAPVPVVPVQVSMLQLFL